MHPAPTKPRASPDVACRLWVARFRQRSFPSSRGHDCPETRATCADIHGPIRWPFAARRQRRCRSRLLRGWCWTASAPETPAHLRHHAGDVASVPPPAGWTHIDQPAFRTARAPSVDGSFHDLLHQSSGRAACLTRPKTQATAKCGIWPALRPFCRNRGTVNLFKRWDQSHNHLLSVGRVCDSVDARQRALLRDRRIGFLHTPCPFPACGLPRSGSGSSGVVGAENGRRWPKGKPLRGFRCRRLHFADWLLRASRRAG